MTASTNRPAQTPVLPILKFASLITALGAVAQFLIGGYQYTAHSDGLLSAHSVIGVITLLAGVVATIAVSLLARVGGNRGLMFHILGTTVLILVQYALGEMASSTALVIAHMAIGVIIMVSAIAMTTLAFRKPFARA